MPSLPNDIPLGSRKRRSSRVGMPAPVVRLEFAAPSGAYLGDVQVTIAKPDGNVVLSEAQAGPQV